MIIIGYQGIGKSTLCKEGNGFIDLESGNFWVEGVRDRNWAVVYANIAVHLCNQGYHVFTSSHKIVRDELRKHISDTVDIAVCYPMPSLKDVWCDKLKRRFQATGLEKDYKAWMNAQEMYDENIMDLSDEPLPMMHIPLYDMHYDLREEVMKRVKMVEKRRLLEDDV